MHRYSGIRVEELLNIDSMKGAKILAGKEGLNRVITKLNIMEVPDIINWVEEGEFLLTTAYLMKDNIEQQLTNLILQLNEKGLAGLGIKTKRYIDEIPKSCLKVANKLAFPLLEIPYGVSYSAILTEALTEIVNAHANTLYRVDNLQNHFINIMLEGGGLEEIASAVHNSIGANSMAITEFFFQTDVILCQGDKRKYIENIISMENIESLKERLKNKHKYEKNHVESIDILGGEEVKRHTITIYSGDTIYGCIFIWEDKKPLLPMELSVIEASTSIIALDIYKRISMLETESKHKIEFFEDLFSGDENRYKKVVERADYFNFDINQGYTVIKVNLRNNNEYENNNLSNTNEFRQNRIKLLNTIQKISKVKKNNTLCAIKGNSIIILFGFDPNEKEGKVKQDIKYFCEEILDYTKCEYFGDKIYIGIGRNYRNVEEVWRSYKEASRVVECQQRICSKKITYYDELGIYRILSFEGLETELDQFYKEMLGPLVEYDRVKGTDLVLTLSKYFETQGNLKEMSEELFIHYNTVVYRLQRIKEIISMDLDNYEDRLNLQISLKILGMQKD